MKREATGGGEGGGGRRMSLILRQDFNCPALKDYDFQLNSQILEASSQSRSWSILYKRTVLREWCVYNMLASGGSTGWTWTERRSVSRQVLTWRSSLVNLCSLDAGAGRLVLWRRQLSQTWYLLCPFWKSQTISSSVSAVKQLDPRVWHNESAVQLSRA